MAYPIVNRVIVNREAQRAQIEEALGKVEEGQAFAAIEYFGIGGQGKSTILEAAKSICREDKSKPFVTIDFTGSDQNSKTGFLLQICDQLDHYFPFAGARSILTVFKRDGSQVEHMVSEAKMGDPLIQVQTVQGFQDHLVEALGERPLVLMLDSVEYCSEDLFNWIGELFLEPLVAVKQPRLSVVLFMAGRGPRVQESQWSRNLLKVTASYQLDPLTFAATETHLESLAPDDKYKPAAKQIYTLTNGHPYSTESLVGYLRQFDIAVDTVHEHQPQLARHLHEAVIQRYILSHADTPVEWALPLLELASIARKFDAGFLAKLDSRYRPTIAAERSVQWYAARVSTLVRPLHLARVGRAKPAYELDQTLRRLLHTALVILDAQTVIDIHEYAQALHQEELERIRRPDELTAYLTLETLYHTAQIAVIQNESVLPAVNKALTTLLRQYFKTAELTDTLPSLQLLEDILLADSDLLALMTGGDLETLQKNLKEFTASAGRQIPFELSHLDIGHTPPTGYTVSWFHANEVVLPVRTVHSALRFSHGDWREKTLETGKTAFAAYLPSRAQEFVRARKEWAIQIVTNWTDIPWELLHDHQDFLCLSRPIARKPRMIREARHYPTDRAKPPRALVIGNPTGDLPGARQEAEAIAKLLIDRGVEVNQLIEDEASAANFAHHLVNQHYDLIHYAGHSYFDDQDSHMSGLEFKDSVVYAEELERLLHSPAFVFFSSCEGAASKTTQSKVGFRGEFIEGLATSALLGGAVGCLGPMWPIGDRVAKEFALAFYNNLFQQHPIGEAVRRARKEVYEQGVRAWASWILYGDPLRQINV